MNWTAVAITAIVCAAVVALAFINKTGDKKDGNNQK